ncbi:MAG: hypothetical protein SO157_08555 [Bullifex sp.]|nr:hypothetical protein [Bullifex sp.]
MLQRIKNQWKDLVACEVKALAAEKGFAIEPDIQVLTPPKPELGDVAFPMFAFAKAMRMAPPAIAAEVKSRLEKKSGVPSGELLVAGPYLNLKIDTSALAGELYERVSAEGDEYGKNKSLSGRRIMIEFSCPQSLPHRQSGQSRFRPGRIWRSAGESKTQTASEDSHSCRYPAFPRRLQTVPSIR